MGMGLTRGGSRGPLSGMRTDALAIVPRLVVAALMLGGCAASRHPASATGASRADAGKPRVVVTTDPELDDSNSLPRYLLYSTDFRTEGLVYASSQFHWKGDGTGRKLSVPNREYNRFGLNLCPCESWRWAPNERFIDDAVDVYERIHPNLGVWQNAVRTIKQPAREVTIAIAGKYTAMPDAYDGDRFRMLRP